MPGQGFINGKPWFRDNLPIFGGGSGCGPPCSIVAAFDYQITERLIGQATVAFNDLSVPSPGETIQSWLWDFGDGNTSTLQNPVHTFDIQTTTTFNVCLTVTDTAECVDQSCQGLQFYGSCNDLFIGNLSNVTAEVNLDCYCYAGDYILNYIPGSAALFQGPINGNNCLGFPENVLNNVSVGVSCFGDIVIVGVNVTSVGLTRLVGRTVIPIDSFSWTDGYNLPYTIGAPDTACPTGVTTLNFSGTP